MPSEEVLAQRAKVRAAATRTTQKDGRTLFVDGVPPPPSSDTQLSTAATSGSPTAAPEGVGQAAFDAARQKAIDDTQALIAGRDTAGTSTDGKGSASAKLKEGETGQDAGPAKPTTTTTSTRPAGSESIATSGLTLNTEAAFGANRAEALPELNLENIGTATNPEIAPVEVPMTGTTGTGVITQSPDDGVFRDTTQAALANNALGALETQAEGEFDAAAKDKAAADAQIETIQGQTAESTREFDDLGNRIQSAEEVFQGKIDTAQTAIADVAAKSKAEFDRLSDTLATNQAIAVGRLDQKESAALGAVMEGRAAAMQAAVSGIQGNVATSLAEIQANPNLSESQKASMSAQVRLTGASALAPAIGANILEFNKLGAQVATSFANNLTNIENTGQQVRGAFAQTAGTSNTKALLATKEMTNQLLNISSNATAAFTNAQSTLLASQSHAQMVGNDLELRTMAEFGTPTYQGANVAIEAYNTGVDLVKRDMANLAAGEGLRLAALSVELSKNTPLEDFIAVMEAAGGGFGGAAIATANTLFDPLGFNK